VERLQRMMNIAVVGVIIFDRSGTLIDANDAFLRMTGYTREDVVRKSMTWRTIIPPEYIETSDRPLGAFAEIGQIAPYEREFVRKDGTHSWMIFAGAGLGDGTIIEYCIDVSDRKRTEDELYASKLAAEEANRMKDEFLAVLSHELRTPLSAILLWVKMLQDRLTPDNKRLSEGLSAIKSNADAQQELINDLLDVSRITSGQLRLEMRQVDLPPIVRAAVDDIAPTAEAKGVNLKADLLSSAIIVRADAARLRQIVWNLLTNAVKFTPARGHVEVSLHRVNGEIEIRVSDTGRGIPPDLLPHVFERFRQADLSTTRTEGGMGLGLTIVKQLVELHGGSVVAESAGAGRGARFSVRLPIAQVVPRNPPLAG
jgi:PAS domain S-box-containing protein